MNLYTVMKKDTVLRFTLPWVSVGWPVIYQFRQWWSLLVMKLVVNHFFIISVFQLPVSEDKANFSVREITEGERGWEMIVRFCKESQKFVTQWLSGCGRVARVPKETGVFPWGPPQADISHRSAGEQGILLENLNVLTFVIRKNQQSTHIDYV